MAVKYTRDNISNEVLLTLRQKVREREHEARDLVDAIDDWMRRKDEKALGIVLAALNEDP